MINTWITHQELYGSYCRQSQWRLDDINIPRCTKSCIKVKPNPDSVCINYSNYNNIDSIKTSFNNVSFANLLLYRYICLSCDKLRQRSKLIFAC